MEDISLLPIGEVPSLGRIWKDLEDRADGSFFLSWSWIGPWLAHLPAEAKPHVLMVRREGRIIGLCILCHRMIRRYGVLRTPSWLLHETGDPLFDRLSIEYNGVLSDRACADSVIAASLLWVARQFPAALVLSGLDAQTEALARRVAAELGHRVHVWREDTAKLVDLNRVRRSGGNYRSCLGRNTRASLNRAIRLYEARGPVEYQVARDVDEALVFFHHLEQMHRISWAARGKLDSFCNPAFSLFHRDLILNGLDAVRLCRLSANGRPFGYLYNFVWRGRVFNYQSGFAYEEDNRIKPGLVSHALAIEDTLARGEQSYDFMAGSSGHKVHLSNTQMPMNWISLTPDCLTTRLETNLHRAEVSLRQFLRKTKSHFNTA